MKKRFLLSLDGGTGSFRAVLFNEDGEQVGLSQKEWFHKSDPLYPGSMNFDYESNWILIASCIKELIEKNQIDPLDIKGVSTTTMREGIVLYDQTGKELMAFANVDSRSTEEAKELKRNFPDLEKKLYKESGQTFALSAIPRLLWIKKNKPDIYERIYYVNMLNDWIAYKLTGILTSEPSNACTTGLVSLTTRQWDSSIAKLCGIKDYIFPNIQESGSPIGNVCTEASKRTGLAESTVVVTGGGDAQLGCLGVGTIQQNQVALFGGSFWQYEYNTDNMIIDNTAKLRINCHAAPGIWQYEAIAWNVGLAIRWFRDAFCQYEKKLAQENNTTVYSYLDEHAQNIPAGSHGMYSIFSNMMNFINLKHAAPSFINFEIDSDKFNKYTFYKSLIESAAFVTYGHMNNIAELTNHVPTEIIFSGGSSSSPLCCQIVSDVLGVKVKTPVEKEATALGGAFLAGIGTGVYKDLSEATSLIKWDKTYFPDMENHAIYNKMFENWQKIYKTQLDLSDKKLTQHMWIAPGVE